MIRRFATVPDFFSEAEEMRRQFEHHFDAPYQQCETTHGIWNYWFVPQMYNYLRTDPARIFDGVLDRFMATLRDWSRRTLGLTAVGPPSIHLYLDGCGQGLHSDFHNGIWGWVFSLTRWDKRTFEGGETLLFRDGVPNYKRHHVGGAELYELVPARFNQLLVFDDRIVHAVRPLQGTMDPTAGRVVLNGHLYGGNPVCESLDPDEVTRRVGESLPELGKQLAASRELQGMISVRVQVAPDGRCSSSEVVFNNLVSSRHDARSVEEVSELIRGHLMQLRFPTADQPSSITIPVLVPLPAIESIRITTRHSLGVTRARDEIARAVSHARFHHGLDGVWEGDVFRTICPGPGFIAVTEGAVEIEIAIPMMIPSQVTALRQRLQSACREEA